MKKGFTLIELMIVIAILGILASVIIPNAASYYRSSRLSAANAEVAQLKMAIITYSADNNGVFPNSTVQLNNYVTGVITGNYTLDSTNGNITAGNGWPFTFNATSQWQR